MLCDEKQWSFIVELLTLSSLHLERTSLYTVEKHNNE